MLSLKFRSAILGGSCKKIAESVSWHGETEYTFYGSKNDLPEQDDEGNDLRGSEFSYDDYISISEGEFQKLLDSYTNGQNMTAFEDNFTPFNEKNFVSGLSVNTENNSVTDNGVENLNIYEIGDTIKFGAYEKDGDDSNGTKPIEWQIIEKTDEKALLLSTKIIDAVPY